MEIQNRIVRKRKVKKEKVMVKENFVPKYDSMLLGTIAGIIGPVLGFFVYFYVFRHEKSLAYFWELTLQPLNTPKVMVLSLLFNLVIFFLFIRFNMLYTARGVILATILWGGVIMYFKYLI